MVRWFGLELCRGSYCCCRGQQRYNSGCVSLVAGIFSGSGGGGGVRASGIVGFSDYGSAFVVRLFRIL